MIDHQLLASLILSGILAQGVLLFLVLRELRRTHDILEALIESVFLNARQVKGEIRRLSARLLDDRVPR